MNTVKYVAEGNCKVKVGGVIYSGKKVIPVGGDNGLSEKEVERLLKERFIRKVELDEDDKKSGNGGGNGDKPLDRMNKAELTAKAAELGIEVTEAMTKAEILRLITEKLAETKDNES